MAELKRCPFCGWEAELTVDYEPDYEMDDHPVIYAHCYVCGARTKSFYATGIPGKDGFMEQDAAKRAIEFWNRRAKDGNG